MRVEPVNLAAGASMLLVAAAMLAGCAATPNETDVGQSPARYKDIARDYLRTSLFDPYTARDFSIAPPKIGQIHIDTLKYESGWVVCYRGNAKNRMGGYTGIKEGALLIKNDKALGSMSDSDHYDVRTNCKDAKYESFSLN